MRPAVCDDLHAFVGGALSPADADAFRLHLATCEACANELQALMMVEALEQTHAPAPPPRAEGGGGDVPVVRPFRSRFSRVAPVVLVPLMAAAAWLAWAHGRRPDPAAERGAVASLESAPLRGMEARLTYAGADAYRPYDVARAAEGRRHEEVPLATLAALETKGDLSALAAGLALSGDDARAETYLARAPASPDVDADRAAILLDEGKTHDALVALDAVLARSPAHPQALYNRAIALRDLEIPLAAAEAFDRAATLGEPGWSAEASAQAASLRATFDRRHAAWDANDAAALAMGNGGPVVGDAVVNAAPDLARGFLYQALRTAPSKARVLELAPLATRLDARAGGHVLSDLVERVSRADFARRAPLAATYAKILAADVLPLDAREVDAYLAALRAARQDDMLLGAIQFTGRLDADLAEYERLSTASGDPWFPTVAAHARYEAQWSKGDWVGAEGTLRAALAACSPAHLEWRCASIEYDLVWLLTGEARTTEAWATGRSGLARARSFAPYMEPMFAGYLANVARMEGDTSLLQAQAHEMELEAPGDCRLKRDTQLELADARAAALDVPGLVKALDATPRCGQPIPMLAADEIVDAVRLGGSPAAAATLRQDVAEARGHLPPDEAARADVTLARLTSVTDPAAGEREAERALDSLALLPPGDGIERQCETYARRTIAVDAALQGHAADALEQIAASVRAGDASPAPGPCSLGVTIDGPYALAVTRDAQGNAVADLGRRTTSEIAPASFVAPAARARLASCPSVRVYAMPPLHGLPALLAPSVAWAYVSSAADAPPPAGDRRLVISDVQPPASLDLPRLGAAGPPPEGAEWLHGADATPSAALARMADATEIEIDAHGMVDAAKSSASVVALSPDADGHYALSAADLAPGMLHAHPVVVLGACHAAKTASYLRQPWSLPSAFVRAGARAVLASPGLVSDAQARPFFGAVLARIRAGSPPSIALRDERVAWLARDPTSWVASVMDFE